VPFARLRVGSVDPAPEDRAGPRAGPFQLDELVAQLLHPPFQLLLELVRRHTDRRQQQKSGGASPTSHLSRRHGGPTPTESNIISSRNKCKSLKPPERPHPLSSISALQSTSTAPRREHAVGHLSLCLDSARSTASLVPGGMRSV